MNTERNKVLNSQRNTATVYSHISNQMYIQKWK